MRFTKAPNATPEELVLFYASKMKLLDNMANDPDLMSEKCEHVKYFYDCDEGDYPTRTEGDTCNKKIHNGEPIEKCSGCEANSKDYKIKRKHKSAFGVAQKAMLKNIRLVNSVNNKLCKVEKV